MAFVIRYACLSGEIPSRDPARSPEHPILCMTTDTKSELAAILTGAAVFPLDDRAFLRITGSDATRWLNGMVTNSIQSLAPGEGNYNFLLNAQGRIQGDCTIYREPGDQPTFLLETDTAQLDTIQRHLDKFIIMDDVELNGGLNIIGQSVAGMGFLGASAPELIRKHLFKINDQDEQRPLTIPKPATMTYATIGHWKHRLFIQPNEGLGLVFTPPASSTPLFNIWLQNEGDRQHLRSLLEADGAIDLSNETQEAFRILSGTPRFGTDIRDRDLPQETNQTHALHFTKGCYLGQEIVERIHSRGQVHRTFSGFRLTAMPASLPAPLTSDGKPAGELTSAAVVPLPEGDAILALGYVRREALDRNQPLDYEGGTATPAALPFRPSE
jgi:folate-binding protein YgfZ